MSNHLLRVFTRTGVLHVSGLDREARSAVASHWNAIRDFLESGDPRTLQRMEAEMRTGPNGVTVGDVELGFDLDAIEREAFRGEVQFESIYES